VSIWNKKFADLKITEPASALCIPLKRRETVVKFGSRLDHDVRDVTNNIMVRNMDEQEV